MRHLHGQLRAEADAPGMLRARRPADERRLENRQLCEQGQALSNSEQTLRLSRIFEQLHSAETKLKGKRDEQRREHQAAFQCCAPKLLA